MGWRKPNSRSEGLSPRRRGNPMKRIALQLRVGSIPAQAGEPAGRATPRRVARVYPRPGGGTNRPVPPKLQAWGLSPRRRGNQDLAAAVLDLPGSIPAQAGEPFLGKPPSVFTMGLSPRRRGNPRPDAHRPRRDGSIPAQAGEPPSASSYARAIQGLSPRRRGNRRRRPHTPRHPGSIPAQAGEPHSIRRGRRR